MFIHFMLPTEGVLTIERSRIVGVKFYNPQVVAVFIILDSGESIFAPISYEYAMKTLREYDETEDLQMSFPI